MINLVCTRFVRVRFFWYMIQRPKDDWSQRVRRLVYQMYPVNLARVRGAYFESQN